MNALQFMKFKEWHDYIAKVPKSKFYMPTITRHNCDIRYPDDFKRSLLEHTCGTAACAAGYLPVIFPQDWKYSHNLVTVSLTDKNTDDIFYEYEISSYFGISANEARILTIPDTYCPITTEDDGSQDYWEQMDEWDEHGAENISPLEVCAEMRKLATQYGYSINPPN